SRDAFREALEELFFEGRVDVDALNRNANLSRVIVATLCQWLDETIQGGVFVDDHWRRSAVLERTAGPGCQLGAERPADLGRTDEAEKANSAVSHQSFTQAVLLRQKRLNPAVR